MNVKWFALRDHEAEIRWLIGNVESRSVSINSLARVMKIMRRRNGLEVQATTDRLAQWLGRELVRDFRGRANYRWAHPDKLLYAMERSRVGGDDERRSSR